MNMATSDVEVNGPFPRMALLARSGRFGRETLWRYLCADEQALYVIPVSRDSPCKNSQAPVAWPRNLVAGLIGQTIVQIEEVVCPRWMLEATLSEDETCRIAEKFNLIAWMLETGGDLLISDSSVRGALISECAKTFKVHKPWIRTLLTRHFYYGGHKNALMHLNRFKGAPGVSRFDITKKKMGRPNDSMCVGATASLAGRNMTRWHLRALIDVVREQFAYKNNSARDIYDRWRFRMVGINRGSDGVLVSYPVRAKMLPERPLVLKYAAQIVHKLELQKKRIGSLEWNRKFGAKRGHSEDLASDSIDIYEVDGMEFNIELLFGERTGRSRHVGKPLVMLAVCQRSHAIVGWYVSLGRENGLAYKHCLFTAFTPKEEHLSRWGVPHLSGLVYGTCQKVIFDRGPGISISPTEAITGRLRVDMTLTKPQYAEGKGVVENVNALLQKMFGSLPGAFERTESILDQDKHSKSERDAAITYGKFMQLLLKAISDHNLYSDVTHLVTRQMLDDKGRRIQPNPKSIFLYNLSNRHGDAACNWPDSTIYKWLLDSEMLRAPKGVVTRGKAQYRSDELSKYYEDWKTRPHGGETSPSIQVLMFQETTQFLLWERADGSLSPLRAMDRSERRFGTCNQWEHGYVNKLLNNELRKQNHREIESATFGREKQKVLADASGKREPAPKLGAKRLNREVVNRALKEDAARTEFEILGVPLPDESYAICERGVSGVTSSDDFVESDVVVDVDW